jgi:hypothetical protein
MHAGSATPGRAGHLGRAALAAQILAAGVAGPAAALPPGFTLEPIGTGWNEAVGMTFRSDGGIYVWERGGRIWFVDANGNKSA